MIALAPTPVHVHVFEPTGPNRDATVAGEGFAQRFGKCRCGLAERRRYMNGRLFEVRFQLPGVGDWIDPVEWLSIRLPVIVCPRCEGQKHDVGSCGLCGNLGVLDEDGDRYV